LTAIIRDLLVIIVIISSSTDVVELVSLLNKVHVGI